MGIEIGMEVEEKWGRVSVLGGLWFGVLGGWFGFGEGWLCREEEGGSVLVKVLRVGFGGSGFGAETEGRGEEWGRVWVTHGMREREEWLVRFWKMGVVWFGWRALVPFVRETIGGAPRLPSPIRRPSFSVAISVVWSPSLRCRSSIGGSSVTHRLLSLSH
ncbi:uncharacterized protein G2W53_044750 [Senna tora]|uniref:Uncharacterized protein n=1 Tax=Senna tora TaxID=362788 RepID=A0A834SEJ5_9FABA|nr:uncharacterized protein G2W53_044750 [Senna tora]